MIPTKPRTNLSRSWLELRHKNVSIARDISARKQIEKALQLSEKRFQDIAANSREWVWEVDREALFTDDTAEKVRSILDN